MTGRSWTCHSCAGANPSGTRFCGHCGVDRTRSAGGGPAAPLRPVDSIVEGLVTASPDAGDRPPDEHRLVTAMFVDLAGFTSLSDSLDSDDLVEIMHPILKLMTDTVARYGGHVGKYAGDAILAFFGAPVSHEDDAARALFVALELHAKLPDVLRAAPTPSGPLALHIGINTGHVVSGAFGGDIRLDYSLLGDAVNVAQRLESVCPPGQTYVGAETYQLTADRFEFEFVGDLTLKGKSKPVPAWRLLRERRSGRDGLSPPVSVSRLVGRDEECARLQALVDEVATGSAGEILVITGDAGVGKSRLLTAGAEHAGRESVRWLEARGISYGSALAYFPYAELFRRLFGITAADESGAVIERLSTSLEAVGADRATPFIASMLGVGGDGPDLGPEAMQREIHRAVADVLAGLATARPTVLALEDFHWADTATLSLTREILRLPESTPLALVLTGRHAARSTIEDLVHGPGVRAVSWITLDALAADGVGALCRDLIGGDVAPDLVARLLDLTGGNPFFLTETVRTLRERGVLTSTSEGWSVSRPHWDEAKIPSTVEGVISARMDSLPAAERTTLQLASVVGRRALRPLVHAVAEPGVDVSAAIGTLVDQRFLGPSPEDPENTVVFDHALTQQVAYSRLVRGQRRRLHRRVADAAENLYGGRDDLIDLMAHHLYFGDAGAKAVDVLLRAAERAKRIFANREAILHLERAAESATRHPDLRNRRIPILADLAQLRERVGDYEESLRLYIEYRDLTGDVVGWRGIASVHRQRGEITRALEVLAEAIRAVTARGDDIRPLLLEEAWCRGSASHYAETLSVLEHALAIDPDRADVTNGYLSFLLARCLTSMGLFDAALEAAHRAERLFDELGEPAGSAATQRVIGGVHHSAGRLDAAASSLRQALGLAERVGDAAEIAGCLINLALVELERNNVADAVTSNRRAVEEFERIGHGTGRAIAYANLAESLMVLGALDEAADFCDRAEHLALEIGNLFTVADAQATRATLHLRNGELRQSWEAAESAAERFASMGVVPRAAAALQIAADAREAAGDHECARQLQLRAHSLTADLPVLASGAPATVR